MKKVIVRINDNYSIDQACAAILKLYGYLSFVEQFRSFQIITFECPAKYEGNTINQLRALNVVKNATWDSEVYAGDPMPTEATLSVDTSGTASNNESEGTATSNTRTLTTTGSGTVYVKVQNIGGSNFYVYSQSQGGTYSRFANQLGFLQGGTYTFDQSDSSNATHGLRFSETPDGIWTTNGTGIFSTGVVVTGTAGTDGQTTITVSADTPSILYPYCINHPGMGRYSVAPDRFGTINIHDFWHLDRITKQDRQYLNRQFSQGSNSSGNGVDIYVIDSGVRGASRPTGNNAALHPELYDPDFVTDLNGTAEQQNYRVNQLSHYSGAYGTNNEDDNGHGTYCAILSAGRTAGIARNAKIYALKAFNSSNSGSYTAILGAYQAVIDHNDSGNGNYKGNTRPAIINASFGPTIPSENYPYVELNDAGSDNGVDEEILDDIEGTISSSHNIIVVRAAGNGFKNSSDQFVGPLQTKAVAGSRTAGYADNTNGGINTVDTDQKKICVGASEYNDRWADFSNYGSGVTTVAPGARILSPAYDWTANTPYTSTFNYDVINGTSFSCPLVTGIIATYCSKNGYTANTNNLAGNAKTFARAFGATGNITVGAHSNYPTNSIEDKKLVDNPFETFNGSNQLVVKFNPSDSGHFIGNVGKKCQLRTVGSTAGAGSSTPTTFNLTTTAPGFYYNVSGTDRNGSVSGTQPTVTCYVGDTLNFNLSSVPSNHPFYVRNTNNTNVTTPTASGQGSVGTATVSWTPNTAGTYRYICGIHGSMVGTITVQSAPGGSGGIVVGGINVSTLSQSGWLTIQAESAVNNTITLFAPNNATSGTTGGGANNYLALIKSEELMHESYDGVVSTSVTLRSQTDTQESAGSGSYTNVVYYPVDSGVDFNYAGTGSTLTTKRGAFFPFIDTNVSWARSTGNVGTFSDGDTVNIDLGLSGTTFAGEPTLEFYSLSGDSIGSSGLSVDTATGIISGTVTSDYIDTTFNFTVLENITGNAQSYSFTTTGTGVVVNVTQQPVSASLEAGSGNTVNFGPVFGISSDGSTIIYQWEVSTNGGLGWSPLVDGGGYTNTGTNTLTVDDDFAKNNYQFRCKLETSTSVAPSYTNAVTVTIFRVITISNQPTNSNPIAPASGSFTVAGSTADTATIAYQWEKSENGDGVNFTPISGANSTTYTTPATTYDADYGDHYRCVLSANGATDVTSSTARLFVQRTINITSQPTNTTGAVGGTSSFGVAATTSDNDAGDITYQWQVSITNGSSWSDVIEGTGGTTTTYTTPTLTTTYDEYQYRCLLSCAGATTIPSNAATLQVETVTVVVSSQPTDQTVNESSTATFTTLGDTTMAPVGGNAASSSFEVEQFDTPAGGGGGGFEGQSQHEPSVTYQWEKSDNAHDVTTPTTYTVNVANKTSGHPYFGQGSGKGYYIIGGVYDTVTEAPNLQFVRGATYVFNQNDASNTTHAIYFSEVESAYGGLNRYETGVTYTLDGVDVSYTAYDSGFATATNRQVSITVDVGAPSTLYYACQAHQYMGNAITVNDVAWGAIGGATSASYTTSTTTYADDNLDQYRCVISATGGVDVTTNAATLNVQRTFSITAQPSNPTADEGSTASFSVSTSSSSGTPTFQWERSDDNGANYTTVAGATSSSYTTPTLVHANDDEDRYRVVVSLVGSAADITSNHGLLTVLRVISISQQPVDTGVIEGQTATFSITAAITSDSILYQWQKSTDNALNWSNINGANSSSYTTPATVFPTNPPEQFRCVLSNTEATTVTSSAAVLTVNESEFVSGPATVTPFIDPDTTKTLSRRPVITTSAFVSEYAGSTHASSFWRIRRVNDNVTVYDTSATFVNGDSGNLTSFTVPPSVLDFDVAYSIQVKFRDNNGLESAYTSAVNFTTPFVDQPEIQTIVPAFNPTINVDAIALKAGYQHTSSDWQFAETTAFSPPIHQSLGNPTNLTSYTLPVNVTLNANTTYYVRIRFNVNPT